MTLDHYVWSFLKWLGMINTLIVIKAIKTVKKVYQTWKKINSLSGKKFDGEPVYGDNDKSIKTKIKSYGDKVNTNFESKKIPKENVSCKCLSLI